MNIGKILLLLSLGGALHVSNGQRGVWVKNGMYEYNVSDAMVSKTYDGARTACKLVGGDLALVKNLQTQNFLWSLVRRYARDFYIGLLRLEGKEFTWIDNSSLNYTELQHNEEEIYPDRTCVVMRQYRYVYKTVWKARNCEEPSGYVCQRRIEATTTQATQQTSSKLETSSGMTNTHHKSTAAIFETTQAEESIEANGKTSKTPGLPSSGSLHSDLFTLSFNIFSFTIGFSVPFILLIACLVKLCLCNKELKNLRERLIELPESNQYEEIEDTSQGPYYENETVTTTDENPSTSGLVLQETPGYEAPFHGAGQHVEPAYEGYYA